MITQRFGPYAILTDGSGEAAVDTDPLNGLIDRIEIILPAEGSLADAAIAFTLAGSGTPVLAVTGTETSASYRPRGATHDEADGSALLRWAGGNGACALVPVAGEALRCAIVGAPSAQAASLYVELV